MRAAAGVAGFMACWFKPTDRAWGGEGAVVGIEWQYSFVIGLV